MKVMKFGGAVLRSRAGFESMIDILGRTEERPLLIVISAFSDATRSLEKAAFVAESGDSKSALGELDSVLNDNLSFARDIINDGKKLKSLEKNFRQMSKTIENYFLGVSITRELTPRTLDAVLSLGEFFALRIVDMFLSENGFEFETVDATSFIVTDSAHGSARPIISETEKNIKEILVPALERSGIVLTQGFVAKNMKGDITTMGLESSNLTAALIACVLDCPELTLWTDVPGFRSADPKLADNTMPLHSISYPEAYHLSLHGFKLIYPDMIQYARPNNMKIIYRSAFEPDNDFTLINGGVSGEKNPIIILKERLSCLNIEIDDHGSRQQTGEFMMKLQNQVPGFFNISYDSGSLRLYGGRNLVQQTQVPENINSSVEHGISFISVFYITDEIILKMMRIMPELIKQNMLSFEIDYIKRIVKIAVRDESAGALIAKLHEFIFDL